MKKKYTTANEFVNMWLEPVYGTTIEKVMEEHPEWKYPDGDCRKFYMTYPLSQEQHDKWYDDAIRTVMKEYRLSKKRAIKSFLWVYLDVAPHVK